MNTSQNNAITLKLQEIVTTNENCIKTLVAKEALEYSSENITDFFDDLFRYGCISGMISELIYYVDTHKFYDTHYAEIEELRAAYETQTGQVLTIDGDLKNFMSWFAFETVAYNLTNELGLGI